VLGGTAARLLRWPENGHNDQTSKEARA
jgi:hypothetical protein